MISSYHIVLRCKTAFKSLLPPLLRPLSLRMAEIPGAPLAHHHLPASLWG